MANLKLQKFSSGFTMLEMVIIVFIFLTGIIGAYSVIYYFSTSAIFSSNQLVASYLSQEGIELVKNLRDNNLINGIVDWKSNIIGNCLSGNVCKIDFNDLAVSSDNGANPAFLKRNDEGFYSYDFGSSTIFKRKITITNSPNLSPDFIDVLVETEWYKNDLVTKEGSVKTEDVLYGYWK